MKFVSKNSNLRVVLRPGLPGQPVTGTPPKAGIYARFNHGVLETNDQEIIDMLTTHSAFNQDFIMVDPGEVDPYLHTREPSEPQHVIMEMQHGTVSKVLSTPSSKSSLSPEMKKYLDEKAAEIAKQQLPGLVKEVVRSILTEQAAIAAANDIPKESKKPSKKEEGKDSKDADSEPIK